MYITTSNNVEGWHNRVKEILNRSFKCRLFEFIQFLSRENEFVNRSCNEIGNLNKHEANETDENSFNLNSEVRKLVLAYVLSYLNSIHKALFKIDIPLDFPNLTF